MYKNYVKRLLDIVISITLIIILSPLFILTSLIVATSIGFPVIFKQTREGKNKKPFTIYKFKILKNGEIEKNKKTMTKQTKYMEEFKLNELPQLFNVIKGDMSLVGPRPFMIKNKVTEYNNHERYNIKPGITGLAQIKGGRNLPLNKKLEYDKIYTEKVSLILDLKILLLTPVKILKYR